MIKHIASSTALAVVLLSGCSSTPENISEIEQLQNRYQQLSTNSNVQQYAPVALDETEESMDKLNSLVDAGAEQVKIDHQYYLAKRKVEQLEATIELSQAEAKIANAETQRNDILLDARTLEARRAEARANSATAQALAAQAQAESAQARAESAEAQAQSARERANEMENKAKELESAITSLTTKQTDRGLVLTLADILFEVNEATIKPGAERSLERISQFLQQYPDREILVEGFTDSTGESSYNQQLSERRAQAVKNALASFAVQANRVQTKGYGEEYPVASNDTPAGRQQNRRVEIVIADSGQPNSIKAR